MIRQFVILSILSVFFISACEVSSEEEADVLLLPTNMTASLISGSNSTRLIADFHYIPDSDLLDHITWSNHQTHFLTYDPSGRIIVLSKMKVKEKVREEFFYNYEGELVSEVILVKKNLDYTYLEPIDSTYTGRIQYEYEGKQVVRESEYGIQKESQMEYLVREASYAYDGEGNMLSRTLSYTDGNELDENTVMTYDSGKHPFSELAYYFIGESFVNNQLSKTIGSMEYSYNVKLNAQNYPEAIYEKLGSFNTAVFRYTYKTR